MHTLEIITDKEVKEGLKKTFSEVKKSLNPRMNHIKFSDIDVRWWIKKNLEREHTMGRCHKGFWYIKCIQLNLKKRVPTRTGFKNLIILSKNYFKSNGIDDILDVFKHELIHLVAKDAHGRDFKYLARACGANRYCEPTKKTNESNNV